MRGLLLLRSLRKEVLRLGNRIEKGCWWILIERMRFGKGVERNLISGMLLQMDLGSLMIGQGRMIEG